MSTVHHEIAPGVTPDPAVRFTAEVFAVVMLNAVTIDGKRPDQFGDVKLDAKRVAALLEGFGYSVESTATAFTVRRHAWRS